VGFIKQGAKRKEKNEKKLVEKTKAHGEESGATPT